MKVKGTGSRCLLEECVKDNYYARFHPHSYHCCKEMKFIPRLDVNFLNSTQIVDGRTNGRTNERKVEPLYRTLLNAGAIKSMAHTTIHPATRFGSLVALHKTVSCAATYSLQHHRSPGSQIQLIFLLSGLNEGSKFFLGW